MLSALFSLLFRLVLAVATVVLVLSLMAVALVSVVGLLLWSLLRGRKPVIDMGRFQRARQARPGFGARRPAQPMGEVVDVEVREVSPSSPRLP
ncbi:hypothetical protein C1O66_22240 [Paucibacter aquatile]|uniref:Uncharacterized protein n=1 Tax=Kinneretia aquatilis TaxID=2070761 RepID=A0A2N8KSL0_9BURK|nr:hypothetical protein [Paucibacter aquatile]PND36412.1 hypothetical protein C1O66_22240 [Paucibacter aquatile]